MIARAYDDGVAFRLNFTGYSEIDTLILVKEKTVFRLLPGTAYALRLKHFRTPYENNYEIIRTDKIPSDRPIALPFLVHLDDGPWMAITEGDLYDYPGMYLYPDPEKPDEFTSRLAPLISDSTAVAVLRLPANLPWRVFMIAENPGKLIESNLIMNLSQPCHLDYTEWIWPGKTAWDWWSDRVVKGRNFAGGMNTGTMKYYIDFAAEAGLEYMLVDAGWYGRHDTAAEDITTTIPEINMPEILRYAASRNVGVWLWVNWECVRDQMDRAFPLYEKWGVKGVKVDYMNGDSQEIVNFYWDVCRTAARYHLMVNMHGAYKPTGLRRAYPNLLTREGVLGLEWSKWSEKCNPDHELILPFTRMLAGPMDFSPGAFTVAGKEKFEARITAPMAMGTLARQLAMYVVYESPLQMLVDHPAAYFGHPGMNFLRDVPTSWDEIKFIEGQIGDYIILARKAGEEWYVGAMTDWTAREINVPLEFLDQGPYMAHIYRDHETAGDYPDQLEIELMEVTQKNELKIWLAAGGGCAIRLVPTWSAP